MNEEQKNIETCLAEDILAEVANVPTDPQFVSLTDEALDPLKQQALQQAGYDGYIKVAGTHQPYTFTSSVKQMKSNLILLLRRLWRYPFGRGTTSSSGAGSSAASAAGSASASAAAPIRSLADMWQHYINRLKGNPEYGIPSRLSSLTDLPAAPALLADRDMSSGIRFGTNPLPDGMSLAQLLCSTSAASSVTEIVDDNIGWTWDKENFASILESMYPNAKKWVLGCRLLTKSLCEKNNTVEYLVLTDLRTMQNRNTHIAYYWSKLKKLELREFEGMNYDYNINYVIASHCDSIEEVIAPKWVIGGGDDDNIPCTFGFNPKLWKVVLGCIKDIGGMNQWFNTCPNLIHLEFGEGVKWSTHLNYWLPTNAIDPTGTDLIEEGSTAQNNLQQFLQNFRDYIANRLTDNGSGLTLTLSQEVRNAIHAAEDEYGIENIIITQKGWTISPAPN